MAKPLAIYTDNEDIDPTPGIRLLERHGFEVRFLETLDPDRILAGAQGAQALLVGYAPIPAPVIAGLPDLRIISLISMGFDHIDLDGAAKSAGVCVTNLPGVASEEVATHALGLILATVRDFPFFERSIGVDWNARPAVTPPRLSQKTLGLLGWAASARSWPSSRRPCSARSSVTIPTLRRTRRPWLVSSLLAFGWPVSTRCWPPRTCSRCTCR